MLIGLLAGCATSSTPAPLETQCEVEVRNESGTAMNVTAFGRNKMELGRLAQGERATFTELCRVERVSVRGVPDGGGDPVWVVVIMKAGKVVRLVLET